MEIAYFEDVFILNVLIIGDSKLPIKSFISVWGVIKDAPGCFLLAQSSYSQTA